MRIKSIRAAQVLVVGLLMLSVLIGGYYVVENLFFSQKIETYEECVQAGYEETYVENGKICVDNSDQVFYTPVSTDDSICKNKCGDGSCAEKVCMGSGCPCAESKELCPADCK